MCEDERIARERPAIPAVLQYTGMDVKPFQPYTVLAFDANGKTTVFAEHKQN